MVKNKIADGFNQSANSYDQNALVPNTVGERLIERLDIINITPRLIVDLGCNTGSFSVRLKQKYSDATLVAVDIAYEMTKLTEAKLSSFNSSMVINADADYIPLPTDSVDLIFSNLLLQWLPDLNVTLAEISRILSPQGLCLFTIYGPDTLCELRQCCEEISEQLFQYKFVDMHDIGDALMTNQFVDPVVDMEKITVNYSSTEALLQQLNGVGAHYLAANDDQITKISQLYRDFINEQKKFPATYEIIYALGYGNPQRISKNGEVLISIASLKSSHQFK